MKLACSFVVGVIIALTLMALLNAFKPATDTNASPSSRGGVTAPEMTPLLAKVTELTERSTKLEVERSNLPLNAKISELTERAAKLEIERSNLEQQVTQLSRNARAADQTITTLTRENARLQNIIQDAAADTKILIGMDIAKVVRKRGQPLGTCRYLYRSHSQFVGNPPIAWALDGADDKTYKWSADVLRAGPSLDQDRSEITQAWLFQREWVFINKDSRVVYIGQSTLP